MSVKVFDPVHAERHGYTKADWDAVSDNPEWTAKDFAEAKPFAEAFPDLHVAIVDERKKRGPVRRKEPVTIRLDIDLVEKLRATGPGWQSRVNDILRRHVDEAA